MVAQASNLSVKAASKRLGISVSKLYQLASAREIAHFRVGGRIVFSEADIDAFMQTCRVAAVAPVATAPRVQLRLKHLRLS